MGRREEFLPDGRRRFVAMADLIGAWEATGTTIPAQFAVGVAIHETQGTWNERDTEPPDEHGVVIITDGVFQLEDSEQISLGFRGDLFDVTHAALVFARLMEQKLVGILAAAKVMVGAQPPIDTWPFLAIAHNQGAHAAVTSIELHGLNWAAYQARNLRVAGAAVVAAKCDEEKAAAIAKLAWWHKVCAYGDDVISGGPDWLTTAPARASTEGTP